MSEVNLRPPGFTYRRFIIYYGYQSGIASAVYKFFNKKFAGANTSGDTVKHANKSAVKSEMKPSQQLPEELNKPIVRKLEKQKL